MRAPIPMGQDGYYHPSSEEELIELIKWAHSNELQLRVRDSGHTFPARAILTDRDPGEEWHDVNLMLDRYRGIRWIDEENGIVEVDAGCNLGFNPRDPSGTSTLESWRSARGSIRRTSSSRRSGASTSASKTRSPSGSRRRASRSGAPL